MGELEPNHEGMSDDDLIDFHIMYSDEIGKPIEDPCARVIAARHHAGQSTELYSFASTGQIGEGLHVEITAEFEATYRELKSLTIEQTKLRAELSAHELDHQSGLGLSISSETLDELRDKLEQVTEAHEAAKLNINALGHLFVYAQARKDKGPIHRWSELWLKSPGELLWDRRQPKQGESILDQDDCCKSCGNHFSEPHDPDCQYNTHDEEGK
jgi:hypothetical protein